MCSSFFKKIVLCCFFWVGGRVARESIKMKLIECVGVNISTESLWIIGCVAAAAGTRAKAMGCSRCGRCFLRSLMFTPGTMWREMGEVSILSDLGNLQRSPAFLPRLPGFWETRHEGALLDKDQLVYCPFPSCLSPALDSAPLYLLTKHVAHANRLSLFLFSKSHQKPFCLLCDLINKNRVEV